jgi:hybrid cluster-associated redox disulfide protein
MEQKITEDMTIVEAIRINPEAVKVFLSHGMHCLGCKSAEGETIAEAAMVHGIDLEKMLEELNK